MEAAVVAATSSVKQALEVSKHLSVKQRSRPVACKSVALSVVILPLGTEGSIGDVLFPAYSLSCCSWETLKTATIRSLLTLHLGWFKSCNFRILAVLSLAISAVL